MANLGSKTWEMVDNSAEKGRKVVSMTHQCTYAIHPINENEIINTNPM